VENFEQLHITQTRDFPKLPPQTAIVLPWMEGETNPKRIEILDEGRASGGKVGRSRRLSYARRPPRQTTGGEKTNPGNAGGARPGFAKRESALRLKCGPN
jgi:hypothetical protein